MRERTKQHKRWGIRALCAGAALTLALSSCTTEAAEKEATMVSFLQKYRGEEQLSIMGESNNPYRITCVNTDGTHTSYLFSCPVWKKDFSGFIDRNISREGADYQSTGYTTKVHYLSKGNPSFSFETDQGEKTTITPLAPCSVKKGIDLTGTYGMSQQGLLYELNGTEAMVYANTNGFTLEFCRITKGRLEELAFTIDPPFENLSVANSITYAGFFLKERSPYFLVKTLSFAQDGSCSPVIPRINRGEGRIELTFDCAEDIAEYGRVLINFEQYVNAAIYDTTSHSGQKKINVVYSNHASLGYNSYWGDVWYYVRLEPAQLTSLPIGDIINARLHFYKLSDGSPSIIKKRMTSPWCSFTTLWNNRLDGTAVPDDRILELSENFLSFDFTKEAEEICREQPEEDYGNLLVSSQSGNAESITVGTADNTNHPVFVEITYSPIRTNRGNNPVFLPCPPSPRPPNRMDFCPPGRHHVKSPCLRMVSRGRGIFLLFRQDAVSPVTV